MTPAEVLSAHAADAVCYLQTIGRSSGRPRTLEIWFGVADGRVYLLAGGRHRAHWVRNLIADPRVRLRIGGQTLDGTARVVEGESIELLARRLLAAKYQRWSEGSPLSSWASSALPVEITVG